MKANIYNLIILDKSGSMSSISNAAISGVNETIASIKVTAEKHADDQQHFFSLVAFCGCGQKYIFENTPIEEVRPITSKDYRPCCMTPLYDAIGFALQRLAKASEGDELPLAQVTIITDGYENASKEFTGQQVKEIVGEYKKKGWTFAYIGANQDSESVAFSISINNSMNFEASDHEVKRMFCAIGSANSRWADRVSDRMTLCKERTATPEDDDVCFTDIFAEEAESGNFFEEEEKH